MGRGVLEFLASNVAQCRMERICTSCHECATMGGLICRLGGDEFLVVSDEPRLLLRRQIRNFRKLVVSDPHHEAYRKMRFGVSCGLANVPADGAIPLASDDVQPCSAREIRPVSVVFRRLIREFNGAS